MRRRRKPAPDPLASLPAELAEFDCKEWARPGEVPDERGFDTGNVKGGWDYHHARRRYSDALNSWFDQHPDASFLEWLRAKEYRARGRAYPG